MASSSPLVIVVWRGGGVPLKRRPENDWNRAKWSRVIRSTEGYTITVDVGIRLLRILR